MVFYVQENRHNLYSASILNKCIYRPNQTSMNAGLLYTTCRNVLYSFICLITWPWYLCLRDLLLFTYMIGSCKHSTNRHVKQLYTHTNIYKLYKHLNYILISVKLAFPRHVPLDPPVTQLFHTKLNTLQGYMSAFIDYCIKLLLFFKHFDC